MAGSKPLVQVLKNSGHLLLMQGFNYALPFLTLPYLFRTIGVDNKGQADFASAIISFLVTIADFGLNITATQQVSIHRNDPAKLHTIVGQVLQIRLLLIILLGIIWAIAINTVPHLVQDRQLFGLTFLLVPAQVLAPTFFFQGQDKMGFYSRLTIASKVLFTLLVFTLIRKSGDYYLVNPLNALGSFVPVLFGWYMLSRQLGGQWYPWQIRPDRQLIKASFSVTVAHLAQNANGALYMVIAGFSLDRATLGNLNIADKLIWPFRQLVGVGFQATFPQVASQLAQDPIAGRKFLSKMILVFASLGLSSLIGILIFAPLVVSLVNGSLAPDAVYYLRLLAPLAFLVAIQVPLAQYLVAGHHKKHYAIIIGISAFISAASNLVLVQTIGVTGVIASITCAEVFVVICLIYQWRKNRPI